MTVNDEAIRPDHCLRCDGDNIDTAVSGSLSVCQSCGTVAENASIESISSAVGNDSSSPSEQSQPEWNEYFHTTTSTEYQVAQSIGTLHSIAESLDLSEEVRVRAVEIYAAATKESIITGRSLDRVLGACLFVAAREENTPRPAVHIGEALDVDANKILCITRHLYQELGIEYTDCGSATYLPYLCSRLGCDERVQQAAEELLDRFEATGLATGKSPIGSVAAAIYCCASEYSQREIAQEAGVSRETIRVRCHDFAPLVER